APFSRQVPRALPAPCSPEPMRSSAPAPPPPGIWPYCWATSMRSGWETSPWRRSARARVKKSNAWDSRFPSPPLRRPRRRWSKRSKSIFMPELPEVETIARGLRAQLVGRQIASVALHRPSVFQGTRKDLMQLPGGVFESVQRGGKYLVLVIRKGAVRWQLMTHLGMSGQLVVDAMSAAVLKHTHFEVALEDGRWLRFRDPRRFGKVALARAPEAGFAAALGIARRADQECADESTPLARCREHLRRRELASSRPGSARQARLASAPGATAEGTALRARGGNRRRRQLDLRLRCKRRPAGVVSRAAPCLRPRRPALRNVPAAHPPHRPRWPQRPLLSRLPEALGRPAVNSARAEARRSPAGTAVVRAPTNWRQSAPRRPTPIPRPAVRRPSSRAPGWAAGMRNSNRRPIPSRYRTCRCGAPPLGSKFCRPRSR